MTPAKKAKWSQICSQLKYLPYASLDNDNNKDDKVMDMFDAILESQYGTNNK